VVAIIWHFSKSHAFPLNSSICSFTETKKRG
jgi:hypothetical protein